jgi:hypothetical protein
MVVVLLIVHMIIVGVVITGARHQDVSTGRVNTVRAFYMSESGMNMAIRELMNSADEDSDGDIGTVSDDADATNNPAIGVGTVLVESAPSGGDTILTSTGTSGEAERKVEATMQT